MADLTVQKVALTGLAPTFSTASAGGDKFINKGTEIIHIKNGGASPITLTIDSIEKCSHGFDHDLAISVPNGGERIIGPLGVNRFNGIDGKVSLTYSAVTSVTLAILSR